MVTKARIKKYNNSSSRHSQLYSSLLNNIFCKVKDTGKGGSKTNVSLRLEQV